MKPLIVRISHRPYATGTGRARKVTVARRDAPDRIVRYSALLTDAEIAERGFLRRVVGLLAQQVRAL